MKRMLAFILAAAALTVTAYASSNTGICKSTNTDVNRVEHGASSTDLNREGGALGRVLSYENPDPVVYIERGQVVLSAVEEAPELRGQALSSGLRSANDYGLYIDVESSVIGIRIWVPSDYQEGAFYVDGSGLLHGMRNSTFSCYTDTYTVHFPAYGVPQYRYTNGTGYQWTDINLTYVDSPNVSILGARQNYFSEQSKVLIYLGGLVVIILWLISYSRSRR